MGIDNRLLATDASGPRQREAEAGGEDDVVPELPRGREGGVAIAEGGLPVEDFPDSGAEAGIGGELDLAELIEVGIDIGLLGEQASGADFASVDFAEVEGGEAVCGAWGVGFVGPDESSEDIESLLGRLAGVPSETAADDGAQIEILKGVGGEISGAEGEEFWIEVVVVAQAAGGGVGAGGGDGV